MLLRSTLILLLLAALAHADPELERRLIDQAPILTYTTARPGLAIDGKVEWWEGFFVDFHLRTRPKNASLTIRATEDGALLMICLNDSTLMYDVPAARFVWLRGCVIHFKSHQTEDGPELLGTVFPRSRERRQHEMKVDLRSIFSAEGVDVRAERIDDESYLLIAIDSENESLSAAAVKPSHKPPFVHFECSQLDAERPWLVLSRIGLNDGTSDAAGSQVTAAALRERGIEVVEHAVGSWSSGLVKELMDGWHFLHAMDNAPTRKQLEEYYGEVGWDELRGKHEEIRDKMKALEAQLPPATAPGTTTAPEGD